MILFGVFYYYERVNYYIQVEFDVLVCYLTTRKISCYYNITMYNCVFLSPEVDFGTMAALTGNKVSSSDLSELDQPVTNQEAQESTHPDTPPTPPHQVQVEHKIINDTE
jgi:hypothetical protein